MINHQLSDIQEEMVLDSTTIYKRKIINRKSKNYTRGKKSCSSKFWYKDLKNVKKASKNFPLKGIDCTIVDARFAKPLDEKLIMELQLIMKF